VLLFVLAFLAAGVLAGSGGIPGFSGGASMEAIEDEAVNAVPTPEDLAPAESAPVRANGHPLLERPEPALPVSTAPRTAPAPAPPAITAKRSVVMDGRTGEVLFARDADVAVPVASCIKILTALTVLRFTDPGEIVTVGQEAADVGEREIYLSPGEQLPVETLTGAMLVGSANDAAAALGLHVGGTMPGYAAVANWVARRLGAKNTNVKNPHGLDEAGHVSTAYDLAVLARAGLADPVFANWVRTPEYSLPWPGHPGPRVATSHNKLLRTYQGAVGVKTGMTNGSGNSLVGAATRGEQTFIVVSLSSQNPTADDTALLDWAFAAFSTVRLVEAGSTVTDGDGVERVSDTDLWATVPKEAASRLGVRYLDGRLEGVLDGEVVSYVAARRAG